VLTCVLYLQVIKLDLANAELSRLLRDDAELAHLIAAQPSDFVRLLNAHGDEDDDADASDYDGPDESASATDEPDGTGDETETDEIGSSRLGGARLFSPWRARGEGLARGANIFSTVCIIYAKGIYCTTDLRVPWVQPAGQRTTLLDVARTRWWRRRRRC